MLKPFSTKESEKTTEAYLVKQVKKLGGLCFKWSSVNQRGVPDRICVFPGNLIFFVEVKSEGLKPSVLQQLVFESLWSMSCVAITLDTKRSVDTFLKELLR